MRIIGVWLQRPRSCDCDFGVIDGVLESWVRSRTLPRRQVERAKIVLAAFRGESSRGIAASVGIARDTARLWMRRYEADGLDGIETS